MKRQSFNKVTKSILLFIAFVVVVFKPILAGELEVDKQALASKQPSIEEHCGVPIINITEPSPGGVSHNIFKEYNVTEQGIIFNNNSNQAPEFNQQNFSILANTPLFINDKLGGRAADIILAEVSGTHISTLLGFTEIYGKGADFILANPNGIYCNGAGFINAHRVTLTTGKPQLDFEGVLRALQVDRGTIKIHGNGLGRKLKGIPLPDHTASPIDILSRAVEISGVLATQNEINIYTGKNKLDYKNKTLTAQSNTADTDKPYLAIDAALVGEIGAHKITIIATEQGVGVNCPPLIATADNIKITANGDIQLKHP